MGKSNYDVVQANQFIGGILGQSSPFGKVFYVDGTNGANGNLGESPDEAFASIAQAIAASRSGKGDTVVIAPGTYTITASLVPKANTTFRAAVSSPRAPSVVISGAVADMVQIDVSGTRWAGIEFKASGATTDNLVDIADAADVVGAEFYDCVFNGNDQTSVVGIQADDATFNTTGLVVKGCLFRDLTGTMIDIGVLGMPYAEIRFNQFAVDANSATAIALADTTAFATGKGYTISENEFTGFDSTGDEVGITIAGTENVTGAGIMRNNFFAYCGSSSVAITQDKLSKGEINNYVGDAATGGTLLDPGT